MGNRKQPFGYKMSLGEIVIQESEAKLVQEIFHRYIAGESLNELTEALRQQDIPYDEGRLWNKNMVARILADTRYTGEKGYPKLIDEEQLIAANEKRSNKPQLPKKTEAQKVLRRLCGTPPSERVEQSVTDLLNGLANCPDCIRHQRSPAPALHSKTQEALDNALEQQPIDEDSAKVLILQLAAEQYAALGNEEYETNRLRRAPGRWNLSAKIVHYFEIQNKKLQITPFRRGFHHKLGVPGRKILIYGDCATRKLPPPLHPEQQIYSAIALFVLLMFVCAKTSREAREVFLRCRSGVLPAAGASGGYSLRRRFHLLLLQITALTRSSP